jgi:phenylacetate-CoA ligase
VDDRRRPSLFCDHTSGTTGTPLQIWSSGSALREWYALFEARTRKWFGLSRMDRWAILGGQLVVPYSRQKPPLWVWNAGMRQLYMSSYHLSPDLIRHYIGAMHRYRVRYLLGYSSALYELARGVLKQNLERSRLDVVITNAEPLLAHQREAIAAAFGCEVKETYGMAEMVAAASECEHGKLHEWPDAGLIERPIDDGESIKFVCTGLINDAMPLIRYEVGDTGRFSQNTCSCGRTLPVVSEIEGRNDDLLVTIDGRRIGRLDPVFKSDLPIHEAQIIQKAFKQLVVKLVPDGEFSRRTGELIAARLRERMGEVNVDFEIVKRIPRTANGKLRTVICEVQSDAEVLEKSI